MSRKLNTFLSKKDREVVAAELAANNERGMYITIPSALVNFKFKGKRIYPGYIITYMMIHDNAFYGRNTGLAAITAKRIAKEVKLNVRTIEKHISKLVEFKLIKIHNRGKKRFYIPLIIKEKNDIDYNNNPIIADYILKNDNDINSYITVKDDAPVIIPTTVIQSTLGAVYKFAYGLFVARSLNNLRGGWEYDSMEDLADYLGVSVSSAYRYLQALSQKKELDFYVEKEPDAFFFMPMDTFSNQYHKQLLIKHQKIYESNKLDKLRQENDTKTKANPDVEKAIQKLFYN